MRLKNFLICGVLRAIIHKDKIYMRHFGKCLELNSLEFIVARDDEADLTHVFFVDRFLHFRQLRQVYSFQK